MSKNQKSGKFHELPRKSINFFKPPPPPRMERGRGGREGGDREGEGGRGREAGKEGLVYKIRLAHIHGNSKVNTSTSTIVTSASFKDFLRCFIDDNQP